jgi:DNA invertase Pin-like site-specific DNA recombinase
VGKSAIEGFRWLLASIAKLERQKSVREPLAGLARARKAGLIGGRPRADDDFKLGEKLGKLRKLGKSIRVIAAEMRIRPTTVAKLLKEREDHFVCPKNLKDENSPSLTMKDCDY